MERCPGASALSAWLGGDERGNMRRALIHLNDEAGIDQFSVEYDDDIGNWLDSFDTREKAEQFIHSRMATMHDPDSDFRDTRRNYACLKEVEPHELVEPYPVPKGCICNPKEWGDPTNIPPICSNWGPMEAPDDVLCVHCEHERGCHA